MFWEKIKTATCIVQPIGTRALQEVSQYLIQYHF